MKCPNCKSSNVQSHILVEDKRARNTKIKLIVLLIMMAIAFLISSNNLLIFAIIALVIVIPAGIVVRIILALIPARQKTLFVCNECGNEFEKDDAIE